MRIANDQLLSSPVDLSSNYNSVAIWLGHADSYAIQLVFSGASIEGDFKLQVSNDPGQPSRATELTRDDIENWTDLPSSTQSITEGGNHMWGAGCAPYRWVRIVWIYTTGAGSLDSVRFNTKGV